MARTNELIAEHLRKAQVWESAILVRIDGKEQKLQSKEKGYGSTGAFALNPLQIPISVRGCLLLIRLIV